MLMDIVIGDTSSVGSPLARETRKFGGMVEAKMLNIRPPRRTRDRLKAGENKRRNEKNNQDPGNGRVMVVLVPDGYKIPKDIGTRDYRILIRFIPQRR